MRVHLTPSWTLLKLTMSLLGCVLLQLATHGQASDRAVIVAEEDFSNCMELDCAHTWHIGNLTPDRFGHVEQRTPLPKEEIILADDYHHGFWGMHFDERNAEYISTRLAIHDRQRYTLSIDIFLGSSCEQGFDTLFLALSASKSIDDHQLIPIDLQHVNPYEWTTISTTFSSSFTSPFFHLGCLEYLSPNVSNRTRNRNLDDPQSFGCTYMFFDRLKITTIPDTETHTVASLDISYPMDIDTLVSHDKQMIKIWLSSLHDKEGYLSISSYASDEGTDDYNQQLSERRAQNIYAYLRTLNISQDRISIHAHGESDMGNQVRQSTISWIKDDPH